MKNEALAVERIRAQKEVAIRVLELLREPAVSLVASFIVLESLRDTTLSRELGGWTLWKWDLPSMRLADALQLTVAAPYIMEAGAKVATSAGAIAEKLAPLALLAAK